MDDEKPKKRIVIYYIEDGGVVEVWDMVSAVKCHSTEVRAFTTEPQVTSAGSYGGEQHYPSTSAGTRAGMSR